MKLPLSIIFFILPILSTAQIKGDYNWIGGYQQNLDHDLRDGFIIDFNENPKQIKYQRLIYGSTGASTSISDDNGDLLFYSNGRAVFNAEHQLMPNGDSLNWGLFAQWAWPDPGYGYPGSQDMIILKDPGYNDGYYLFHKYIEMNMQGQTYEELWMSYIDMQLDNGGGDVVFKNGVLYNDQVPLWYYLTAVRHQNGRDWWIVQPIEEDSVFLTFLIDETGIHRQEYQSTGYYFTRFRSSASGTARFCPYGTRYAIYNYYDQLHLYDFDRETGRLSNHQIVEIYDPGSIQWNLSFFGSVEWSPNGRFIYTSSSQDLFQVDTWEENIQDGVRHIDTYNGTIDPFPTPLFLMVQAPDCKIYMTPKNASYSLHVINKPDKLGKDCDFVQNAIILPNANGGTFPNFPRFRVDEEEKCDPTISSVFGQAVYYRRDLKAFPNPTSGPLTLEIPEDFTKGTLEIIDIRAGTVHRQKLDHPQEQFSLDIGHLPAGVYHIELYPEENEERVFYGVQVVLSFGFD
ncbi:MAG: T9SS C-terminal target domain-containing protein [Saprospirales bacterium]|nr:MAG: T9SS C-terminal target domain-containing protein [Saprospirales bacterium]